jgi:hypothetical protein
VIALAELSLGYVVPWTVQWFNESVQKLAETLK